MSIAISYRGDGAWGNGLGMDLTAAQVDTNFYNLVTAVEALQSGSTGANNITSITSGATSLTFNFQDGSSIGPLPLPVLQFKWRGNWQPNTIYNILDTFEDPTIGLFTVLLSHVSAASFDPNATLTLDTTANLTSGQTAVTGIVDSAGSLASGTIYGITGSGIPGSTTLTYAGGGNGTLSNAATAGGTAVAAVITDTSLMLYNELLPASPGATTLSTLSDVLLSGLSNGQVLTYNSGASKWENGAISLEQLSDVTISGIANGQVLGWNASASEWENGAATIAGLGDVLLTGLADLQFLQWHASASKWVNVAAPVGGGGGTLNPRGNWAAGTVYAPNDLARDGAGFFVCFAGVGGSIHPASDTTHWAEVSIIDSMGLDVAFGTALSAPAAPTVTPSSSGGTLASGSIFVQITLVDPAGETAASAETTATITGPSGSASISSPPATGDATGYRVYAATTTGAEELQTGSSAIAIGTPYTLSTIATGTAAAPTYNTAAIGTLVQRGASGWTGFNPGAAGTYLGSNGAGSALGYSKPPLSGLTGVDFTGGLSDKQYLRYDAGSSTWKPTAAGDFVGTLNITSTTSSAGVVAKGTGVASGTPAGLIAGARVNGSTGSPTAVNSGDQLTMLSGLGWDGTALSSAAAGLVIEASQNWSGSAHGARLLFQVILNGTAAALVAGIVEDDGGLVFPSTATGGSQGPGTVNVSGGYYVNGSEVLTATNLTSALDGVGSTQGDMLYRGSSGWLALAPGNDHDHLLFDGTNDKPAWTATLAKAPVVCAAIGALPSCSYANGSLGVGATLTAVANGTLTIDGHIVAANDTILVAGQSAALQNGIYTCTTAGDASHAFVLTRRTDFDTTANATAGALVQVLSGSVYQGFLFMATGSLAPTIGTTALPWMIVGGLTIVTPADRDVLVYSASAATFKNQRPQYKIGFSAPQTIPYGASQAIGHHAFACGVTIPANFGSYLGNVSQAGGTANATGSTVFNVDRALAASPNSWTNVGTITIAASGVSSTFASSGGSPISFAQGDVMRIVAPATPDATFVGFYSTIVGFET